MFLSYNLISIKIEFEFQKKGGRYMFFLKKERAKEEKCCYFCGKELNQWGECEEHPNTIIEKREAEERKIKNDPRGKLWLRYQ